MSPEMRLNPIAQRASRALAAAVVALGLVATALAPASAAAAPLNPRPGPSIMPDLVVSFKPGDVHGRLELTYFSVIVRNQGSTEARGVRVTATLPDGFTNLKGGNSTMCAVDGHTISCSMGAMPGGAEGVMGMSAVSPPFAGLYPVAVTVDPDNLVRELKETNNNTTGTLTVY